MIFAEMRIKTNNCCAVLLANHNAKIFKKAEYIVAVAERKLSGPLAGACGVAVACVVCLLGCCCLAVPYELHCVEVLTLLTLTAPHFAELADKTLSVAAQGTQKPSLYEMYLICSTE
jgi:hypothetical protein